MDAAQVPKNIQNLKILQGEDRPEEMAVTAENSKLTLTALNTGVNGPAMQGACNYAIGIIDNDTNEIALYDSSMFKLHQSIKNLEDPEILITGNMESYVKARNELDQAFGTRKKKRELKTMEKNRVNISDLSFSADSIAKEITAKTADLPTKSEIQQEINESRPIPPFDLTADQPENIYDIHGIISEYELNLMPTEEFRDLDEEKLTALIAKYNFGLFVQKMLKRQLESNFVFFTEQDLKKLFYLHFLIRFRNVREGTLNNFDQFSREVGCASPAIKAKMLSTFYEEQLGRGDKKRWKCTSWGKDKIAAYVCVLSLMLDNYSTDISDIAVDLGVGPVKISEFYKSVGCMVEKVKGMSGKIARLSAPLTFPKPKMGPRK